MRFYEPGDEIYFFGFSRGAYIARFLAEMLDYIGLLSHGNEEMVKFAWKAFSQWQCRQQSSGSDEKIAETDAGKRKMFNFMKGFRETFSRPVGRIRFLGLFDTVNSVPRFETAWMQRSKFPYTARSSAKVIRHAVSIDERRAKFRQDLIYQGNPKSKKSRHKQMGDFFEHWRPKQGAAQQLKADKKMDKKFGISVEPEYNKEISQKEGDNPSPPEDRGRSRQQYLSPSGQPQHMINEDCTRYRKRSSSRQQSQQRQRPQQPPNADNMSDMSNLSPSEIDPNWDDDGQDIDEIWFAGGHADIGGGWEMLQGRKSASHVPLAWIVREAMRAGLNFDAEKVAEMGCSCSAEWDGANPSRVDASYKKQKKQRKRDPGDIPRLQVQDSNMEAISPSFPESPEESKDKALHSHDHGNATSDDDSDDDDEKLFEGLMNRAHTAPIHDSLSFGGGLGTIAVAGWKFMEYLPFLRMDLKPDGSWEPIRWPLPRGEVRDIPMNVRVHGSVVRRMKEDSGYRPGNLIIGGGGRGVKRAPDEYGIGDWVCVAEPGDAIGEIWERKLSEEEKKEE